jgi:sugar phosphate isomerase/epimerase
VDLDSGRAHQAGACEGLPKRHCNIQGFANPLQGDVPWLAVRSALESVGYQGYITAEVSGYRLFPELGLRHIADALRAVFQS